VSQSIGQLTNKGVRPAKLKLPDKISLKFVCKRCL